MKNSFDIKISVKTTYLPEKSNLQIPIYFFAYFIEINNNSEVAIILIHGFGACKDHWRFNQKTLSSIAPCYALDLLGFGESSKPNSQLLYEKKTFSNFYYCFDNWSHGMLFKWLEDISTLIFPFILHEFCVSTVV